MSIEIPAAFMALLGVREKRRLRMLQAHESGEPFARRGVMNRFCVSSATAKRDIAAVRKALGVHASQLQRGSNQTEASDEMENTSAA